MWTTFFPLSKIHFYNPVCNSDHLPTHDRGTTTWKKLEFDSSIESNGWSIQPAVKTAQLPPCKHNKIRFLIDTLLQIPCRKNLEKIIGVLLWATSLVHHVRFRLTSLYRDLYSIPATNYSIPPTKWNQFLTILNEGATITIKTVSKRSSFPCWFSGRRI